MTDNKVVLLKLHPCSKGLSEDALQDIANAAELVRCEAGVYVHRADEIVTSIYLVIHGRLKLSLMDLQGNVILQRFQSSGGQFGGIAAVLAEPTPVDCIAEHPTTMLVIDYQSALELTKKHSAFRANYARLLAESINQIVFNDRRPVRPIVVACFHQSDETRVVSRTIIERLTDVGETPCVVTDRPAVYERVRRCHVIAGDGAMSEDEIRRRITEWMEAGRVFIDIETTAEPTVASNALEKCEKMFWYVTSRNWRASVNRLRAIRSRAPAWRDKITIVWLLEPDEDAPLAGELRELANGDVKVSFGQPAPDQGPALSNGIERLVHLMRGVKIGVALGGGAARGMAHLGVLKALEQSGITVDMIAGTSSGAMTGTVYSSGLDVDYSVGRFVEDLRPTRFFRCLPHGDQWYLLYKYRRGQFDPMLRRYLKDKHFEQLPVPMHTVAVDLITGKAVVREAGDAVHGIVESINLPGLSKPINRQGEALVDGGLIANVPADVLVTKGCNFVIAVSVTSSLEFEFASNRPNTPAAKMRSASTVQTLLRSYLVQSHSINAIGVQPADFVIEPDVTGFELTEFARTDELAAIGERTTLEAIPRIQELLHQLDRELFPPRHP